MAFFKCFCSLCSLAVASAYLETASDPCRDENGLLKGSCMGAEDEASNFLQMASQRSSQAESLELSSQNISSITPLDCTKYNKPIQVLKSDNKKGFDIAELEVETGTYTTLWSIPFDSIPGGYTVLNACGISPIDSIIYCVMFAKGSWIVRIDDDSVEFVTRLPQHNWNTADFGPRGRFFVSDPHTGFIVIQEPHKLKGYANKKDPALPDIRTKAKMYPKGWHAAADLVVTDADFDGTGTKEYVLCLYGPHLQIALYDEKDDKFSDSWVLNVKPPRWDNIYGAGWNFQGELFFSVNRGAGVYSIPTENITLKNGAPLQLKKIGQSKPTGDNDGMNCLKMANPWITKTPTFDCDANTAPLQLVKRDDYYAVSKLNNKTGLRSEIYTVNLNVTKPSIESLNGIGVGPKDSIMYGCLYQAPMVWGIVADHYFVRFAEGMVEYVAKVTAHGHPVSGAFDPLGNYFTMAEDYLFMIESPNTMKGFNSTDAKDLPHFKWSEAHNVSPYSQVADLVALEADLDGKGTATWIFGVSMPVGKLVVIKPDTANFVKGTESWVIPITNKLEPHMKMAFGSGWNIEGQAYFASNDGAGIFKVPLEGLKIPPAADLTITLEKVGESGFVADNDGMNCM